MGFELPMTVSGVTGDGFAGWQDPAPFGRNAPPKKKSLVSTSRVADSACQHADPRLQLERLR